MMLFISSAFGESIKAKPFDSWVSGLRMTLTLSATRFSAVSHDLISSAVTQRGRFPRNTVKLILRNLTPLGNVGTASGKELHEGSSIIAHLASTVNSSV